MLEEVGGDCDDKSVQVFPCKTSWLSQGRSAEGWRWVRSSRST